VERAIRDLAGRDGKQPTVDAIAEHIGSSAESVLEALDVRNGLTASSLDAPRGSNDDEAGETLGEAMGGEDDAFGLAEHRATLSSLLSVLTERERRIVRLRFEQDLTQEEIGEIVGLSQMQISRILRTSIERLRTVARHGEALQLAA
jgi:RNA polymerase sigma-B factor